GIHTFKAYVNDTMGNLNSTANRTINVDTGTPNIDYVTPTETSGVNVSRNWIFVNVTVADTTGTSNVTFRLYNSTGLANSTSYTVLGITNASLINWSGLVDGVYTYNATVYDVAGNPNSTASRTIGLDTVVPAVTPRVTIYPGAQSTVRNSQSITLNVTVTDATLGLLNVTVNASQIGCSSTLQLFRDGTSNNYNNTCTVSGATTGTKLLTVNATDFAGNSNTTHNLSVTVDLAEPQITASFPVNNANLSVTILNITGTALDPQGNNGTVYVNDSRFGTNVGSYGNWNFTNNTLAEGRYIINVSANDSANNVNSSTVAFTVDRTVPAVSNASSNLSIVANVTPISLTVVASDSSTGIMNVTAGNGTTVGMVNTGALYQLNTTRSALGCPATGNCTVIFTATDFAGNANSSIRLSLALNGSAGITLLGPANLTNSTNRTVVFSFNATHQIETTVNCSIIYNGTVMATNSSVIAGANTSMTLTGLGEAASQNWTVSCRDSSGNTNQSVHQLLAVDATAPVITFSCTPTSVYTNDVISCSCSATDNVTGLLSRSFTANPSAATAGTYSTVCTATDYAGNSDTASVSYTVTSRAGGGSGGGGGGGGGSSTTTDQSTTSQSWDKIEPQQPVIMKIQKESISVEEIKVETVSTVSAPSLSVTSSATKPAEVTQELAGTVFQYLKIEKTNIDDSKLKAATVKFKVTQKWLSDNGIDKSTVTLNRYVKSWEKLLTKPFKEDATNAYYEATTPGFSVFAISGEAAKAKACALGAKRCSGSNVEQCSADGAAWAVVDTCQFGCDAATSACAAAVACSAGELRCSGNDLQRCADGTRWETTETCPSGCQDSKCVQQPTQASDNAMLLAGVLAILVILAALSFAYSKKKKEKETKHAILKKLADIEKKHKKI
ncbi:MAG: PGF-pre-PGF domain-containing protein, partial [Candidatus Aenigmarchaeota archaeon]|nr:PGF-pre-PGF domain-containing protein [Candidatus Aenigmarchaeota archaeon]